MTVATHVFSPRRPRFQVLRTPFPHLSSLNDRIIIITTNIITDIEAVFVEASGDNSFAIDAEGKAYSWGFSVNYQTGQGTDEDVEEATEIDNSAVRGKKLTGAGAGGQFSLLYGPHVEAKTNGVKADGA